VATRIDPRAAVAPGAELGEDVSIGPFCVVDGAASIGDRCELEAHVVVGPHTELGAGNRVSPFASIGGPPDCRIGNRIVFANGATLAGHVEVDDDATVGAYSGVHQFCRVARQAFIGGYSVVTQDALPWVTTVGNRAKAYGLNVVGLKRRGYSKETIAALKKCYQLLFRSGSTLAEGLKLAEAEVGEVEEVRYFLEFVRTSERGVIR
jgi:UDP-N-acetylglucosamine acyltransferase